MAGFLRHMGREHDGVGVCHFYRCVDCEREYTQIDGLIRCNGVAISVCPYCSKKEVDMSGAIQCEIRDQKLNHYVVGRIEGHGAWSANWDVLTDPECTWPWLKLDGSRLVGHSAGAWPGIRVVDINEFLEYALSISKPIIIGQDNVIFRENGDVEVGCQVIPWATVTEIYERAKTNRNE